MSPELLIAILTGLGGMLGWGLADLFAKKTIDEIGDIVTLVIAHIFGTAALIVFALFRLMTNQPITIPSDLGTWLWLAAFGAFQGVVYLLVYRGFGKGQVAVLNPIFGSYSGVVALISIAFLGEAVGGLMGLALAVIFFGVLLLNIDLGALKERRLDFVHVAGFKEIATATVLAAIWTLSWDTFIQGKDWLSFALFMYVFMTAALLIYAYAKNITLTVGKHAAAWKYLVAIGVFEVCAYISISWGFSVTSHTSIVALLSGAFSLPTIILARLWLKERTTKLQAIASAVIILGIVLLAVY